MHYFPICVSIEGRRCIVVGGGRVAERKVNTLLTCGGRVTVVSPQLTEALAAWQAEDKFAWLKRAYQKGDLTGAFLVIAATDDTEVQRLVFEEAEQCNILVNVADVPKWCSFILPATVRQGDLTISVSTAGKSPALARRLREDLEKQFGPEYDVLLSLLGDLRLRVLAEGRAQPENKALFNELLHPKVLDWIRERDWQKIEAHVQKVVGRDMGRQCLAGVRKKFNLM